MMVINKPLFIFFYCYLFSGFIFQPCYAHQGDFDEQLVEINKITDKSFALKRLTELSQNTDLKPAQHFNVLMKKSAILFDFSEYRQAIPVTHQALSIATENKLELSKAKANKFLGVLHYFLAQYAQSLSYYEASLDYYDEILNTQGTNNENYVSDVIQKANLLNNIALIHTSTGKSLLALENYMLAEPIYQMHGDDIDRADIRYNIAVLHIHLRRFDIAITMLKEVIIKRSNLADHYGVAEARGDLGVAYKYSGQYELAMQHNLISLDYFVQNKHRFKQASQLHNVAEIYNDMQKPVQAMNYANQSIALSKALGHQKAQAGALQSLAKSWFYQGDLDKALANITLSTQIAKNINYQNLLVDNLALSALFKAGKHEFSQALALLQQFEKSSHKANNLMLNEQLARFESDQLADQVQRLEQGKRLQVLESTKSEQQRLFIFLAVTLCLLVAFLVYRRYLESRLTKELETRVKQRTHELEYLTKELQQANQIKSQFLANMSHEIRTPLTSIVGQAEAMIEGDVDDANLKDEVAVIHGNSQHLLHLINEILDLSRIEANKFELDIKPYNLANLIKDLSDIFEEQANKKGLTFLIEHQIKLPFYISVDALRVKQVLINMCANAIKFTEKGQVVLALSWHLNQLTCRVSDSGIGMSPEQLSQIFELFTQADNSISRRFGGSGLGLYLSNQLAVLMSGEITAKSQIGEGSTFTFTLPCKQHCTIEQPIHAVSKQDDNAGQKLSYHGLVLLADDHHDNRRLIARLLESLGLNVLTATNGIEAVEICMQQKPQLILLDIQMPEMDGIQAYKKLRQLGCQLPIYALTANAMSHEIKEYLSLGFDGHLKKPIERSEFLLTLAKYFSRSVSSDSTNQIIDKANQQLSDVDFTDLSLSFRQGLSEDKLALLACVEKNEIKKATRIVHQLAGAAQMFGFIELSQVAIEFELQHKIMSNRPEEAQQLDSDLLHCLIDEICLIEKQHEKRS